MELPSIVIYGKSDNNYRLHGVLMVSFGFSISTIHIHLNMDGVGEDPYAIKNEEYKYPIPLKRGSCITLKQEDIKQIITHTLR